MPRCSVDLSFKSMVIFDFSCFETDDDLTLNSTDGSEVGFQNKKNIKDYP